VLHQVYYCCLRCVKSADRRARWKPTDTQFMTFFFRAFQFKKQRKVKEDSITYSVCPRPPPIRFLDNNLARSFIVCSCIGPVDIEWTGRYNKAPNCCTLRVVTFASKGKTHDKRSPTARYSLRLRELKVKFSPIIKSLITSQYTLCLSLLHYLFLIFYTSLSLSSYLIRWQHPNDLSGAEVVPCMHFNVV
jgi:hypothetical protein